MKVVVNKTDTDASTNSDTKVNGKSNVYYSFVLNLFTGFIAAAIAMYATHPPDTIKVQYQADKCGRSVKEIILNIYQKQGLRGFFKGCVSTLSTYPIFWGIFFSIKNQNPIFCNWIPLNYILVNLIGASIASTLCNPLFVLKTRKQTLASKQIVARSYLREIQSIYKIDGFSGFFKGLGITLGSNVRLVFQFPIYDFIMLHTGKNILAASIISKTIANSVFYPTNIIGTIQRDMENNHSVRSVAKQLYQAHGLKGFYKGLLLYNLASCPNFTIMMLIKDKLDRMCGINCENQPK
jgi:hypothetical protein